MTAGFFIYRELESFALKGFEAPFEAAEAVEARPAPSRFLARARGKITPLVGRERELRQILGAWAAARAGHGQVVLLQGEPGIGKSRLVEELRAHAADTPHWQTVWHCGPTHGDSALYPVAQQLAHAAGLTVGDGAEARRDKLGEMLSKYGDGEPLGKPVIADLLGLAQDADLPIVAMSPEKRREVTLNTLLGMIQCVAGRGAALFVLEDAHWSDATTRELLARAIDRAADRSWLILVTARPEYQPTWSGQSGVTQINLDRLDRSDSERICAHLGADFLLSIETLRQIVARSDGIPLFVEEMTKSALEAAAAPAEQRPGALAIPMTVKDLLAARLDRLGPARRIASLGAAIGRRFSYELLAAVAMRPEAELRQGLRDLSLSGLIETNGLPPSSFYVFKHALIRDAAYEFLLKRERQALHGQIAAALRDRFPHARETEPELLAHHFTESGAIADAAPLWAEAGNRAASRAAHAEAASHLQNALDLVRRSPPGPARAVAELPLLLGLGISLSAIYGYSYPEAGQMFEQAQAICDALGNPGELFPVLCGITSFRCVIGEIAAAEELARQCATIADQSGAPEHRILADCYLGYIIVNRGRLTEGREKLENAVALYLEHNQARKTLGVSQDALTYSRACLIHALLALGEKQTADRIADEMVVHARSLERPYDVVFGVNARAAYLMLTGDYAGAWRDAEEVVRLSEEHGYSMYRGIGLLRMGNALGHFRGRDAALPLIRSGVAEVQRTGVKHSICSDVLATGSMYAANGDYANALAYCDEALARARETGEEYYFPRIHLWRAKFLAGLSADGAAAEARRALEIAEAQGAAGFAAEARKWLEQSNALKITAV